MRISTIALANLKRRKGRAGFLAAGIAIGIGTVIALHSLSGTIREEIGTQLDRFGANIVVVPQSNTLSLDYGGISVSGVSFDVHQLTTDDAKRIHEIPYRKRLSVVAPKLLGGVELEGKQVLLAGVDFRSELRLKRWWSISGKKPEGEDEVLVGYEAAQALAITAGQAHAPGVGTGHHHAASGAEQLRILRDRIAIAGRELRVAGVIRQTGGPEDRMIFGSLPRVQELLKRPGELSVIEVSALCKDCPVEDIVAQISGKLPHAKVSAVQRAVRARTETVERLTKFSAVVSAVVLAIGSLLIFTTMMAAVVERTKEIGVLRAIGFRRKHILRGLLLEVAAVSAGGGFAGWAAGIGATWIALPYFTETGMQLDVRLSLALIAVAAALLMGVLSSLYPAIRASRLDPSEAVRYV